MCLVFVFGSFLLYSSSSCSRRLGNTMAFTRLHSLIPERFGVRCLRRSADPNCFLARLLGSCFTGPGYF